MNLIQKGLAGDSSHKSRLHDEKGNMIDVKGLRYLPKSIFTTLLRVSAGKRPMLPWIGYRAIKRIELILNPRTKMLEFGSGMSTAWYASRCKTVTSIEENEEWYGKISSFLRERNVTNVDYQMRTLADYPKLDQFDDGYFDFIMIDGAERGKCAASAVRKVKRNGYIYLDNSDKNAHEPNGDVRIAENTLLKAVAERKGSAEYFVDFVPTYICVTQGLLVKL